MEFTFSNEINMVDIIGLMGWAIGLLVGASWLKRRYANRLESDPMRIFQSNISDLETIGRMMDNSETRYFAREHDGSEDALASANVADVMEKHRIREMIYNGWLISCRDANRRNSKPYLHIRPVPGLYVIDPR